MLPLNVIEDLPPGYSMRSLTRGDFARGFLEVLRVAGKVGYVSSGRWDERCEWLRKRAEEGDEYVLVIIEDKKDRVVGVGRWVAERGL
jgi:glucosamine-phosphate N-acetyltransferase